MTDIVERLRAVPHVMGEARVCAEAADEIERLRVLFEKQHDLLERLRVLSEKQHDLFKRLSEKLSHLEAHRESLLAIIARQALEIAQLRREQ